MKVFNNPTFLGAFVFMIALFLVITHATGAARVVGATGSNLVNLARTFQGR